MALSEQDCERLGVKIGLELHQQLNTKKLFCSCSSEMKEEKPIYDITRSLRPVVGEMGNMDKAALFEFFRKRKFNYHGYEKEACLVDLDEEPPHDINKEALDIAIGIALLLNLTIPNELHVMRKTVLDGSAITGFQRTMLVGYGSSDFNGVRIRSICIEEDAAKLEETQGKTIAYSLSRLGIPLIEVATEPDIRTPQQCRDVAENFGLFFRSFNVKRGIGTIRQDVNVSIREGARVEIKGWQDLRTLTKLIENEVERQANLVEVKKYLEKTEARITDCIDVSDIFRFEACAIKLPKFEKVIKKRLCEGKTLAEEIFDYAKAYGSEPMLFEKEFEKQFREIETIMNCEKDDVILVIKGKDSRTSANMLLPRLRQLYNGVPEETRKPNPDCTTSFSRPLPGSDRMYPETDCLPVVIDKEYLAKIRKSLPKTLLEKKVELEKELPKDIADQMIKSRYLHLYEEITKGKEIELKVLVATTFTSNLKELARSGIDIEKISDEDFRKLFAAVVEKRIARQSIPEILTEISKGHDFEKAIVKYSPISDKELEEIISEAAKNNKGLKQSALMGIIMSKVRGKVDGKKVMEILKKEMEKK